MQQKDTTGRGQHFVVCFDRNFEDNRERGLKIVRREAWTWQCSKNEVLCLTGSCVHVTEQNHNPDLTWRPKVQAWAAGIFCGHPWRGNLTCQRKHNKLTCCALVCLRQTPKEAWCHWSSWGGNCGEQWSGPGWLADPQVCLTDRWGSRRWLTGWGLMATWARRDYKQQEEGKGIRFSAEPAFLTSSLLSHWQHRGNLLSQSLLRVHRFCFLNFSSPPSLPLLVHPCSSSSVQERATAEDLSQSTDKSGLYFFLCAC